MQQNKYPFDLVDLILLLLSPSHPALLLLCVAQYGIRRSGWAVQALIDAGADIPDTPAVRALLPGLVKAKALTDSAPVAHTSAPSTPSSTPSSAPSAPSSISLAQLATSRNILIVGSPGSGKTTLLRALIQQRTHPTFVFDPHAAPDDWNGAAQVIGAGRNFGAVYQQLCNAEKRMDARAKQRAAGVTAFPAVTLAGDEWGSICSEIETKTDAPGRILLCILKEGRKFGINAILSAHGDTAASVGSKGDTQAFKLSFDWIVYCGGYVSKFVGDQVRQFPHGTTPEGNSFPLVVAAVNPATGEVRLLDMRGLTVSTSVPSGQPCVASSTADTTLERLLNVQPNDERSDQRSDRSHAVQDRSGVRVNATNTTETGHQVTDERTNDEIVPTGDELRKLMKALTLYQDTRSKQRALEQAFGCKKGGSQSWKRASLLFDLALSENDTTPVEDDDTGPDPDVGPFGKYLG